MKRISPKRTALEFQFVSSVVQNRLKANSRKVKLHCSTRAKRNTRRRRSVQVEIQFSCKWLGGNRQHISLEIDNYMHIFTSHMFASNAVSLLAVETFFRCCSTLILRRFCYCINELFRIFWYSNSCISRAETIREISSQFASQREIKMNFSEFDVATCFFFFCQKSRITREKLSNYVIKTSFCANIHWSQLAQ